MRNKIVIIFLFAILVSCGKKKSNKTVNYHQGDLTVLTDDSFQSVTEALADGYMINYPETKLRVETKKEDLAFMDLLQGKAKVVVMSRTLTDQEKKEYIRITENKFEPAKFAADAVVFVVPKESGIKSISMEEISTALQSEEKRLIFDGTNSSNLNFVAQKLNKKPSELKYSIINGNQNIIRDLSKYPDKIGVIGLNTLSRPYSKEAAELRSKVRILPVVHEGKTYTPGLENLDGMSYPFTRVLYFLINEQTFNIAHGFIRFSCTHLGQMIVEKEGLQKYYLYKREVQMY